MKKEEFEKMSKQEVFDYCKKEKDRQLEEKDMEIAELKAKHDELSEYTHRIQILRGKLDIIDGNIFYMRMEKDPFDNVDEKKKEKVHKQAQELHEAGDAAARMYNVMIGELENKYSPITKDIPADVKAIEVVKLKYEKLFTVLKYRMLEFDTWNKPLAHWQGNERFLIAHNYFGSTEDDPEEAHVDNLEELRNEKYEFKRPKPKRDYEEPKTEYEKWQWEQTMKKLDEKWAEFEREHSS